MKSVFAVLAALVLSTGSALGAADSPLADSPLKDQRDKVSYTIGVYTGNNLKSQSVDVDPELIARGIKDSLTGDKVLLTNQEMQDVMAAFQKEMTAKQVEKRKALTEKNLTDGEAFLAANKTKEGVQTTASGLQYKVVESGKGKMPKSTDVVVAHYRGTRIDGTEFDSSYQRNEPATIKLDQVIKGWTEALTLMKEGSKWQIFIPSHLAYGENGVGPIEPNSTLIFDVELIKISESAAAPAPKPAAKAATPKAGTSAKPAAATKSSKPAAAK
jgi:FKBP-type peptidyl-prolyl cis-trans isomerase